MPAETSVIDRRVVMLSCVAIVMGVIASVVAIVLVRLIAFVTNLSFFHTFSFHEVSPAQNHLGVWVILVPIVGGMIVGFMARYGSQAIRGHGIPEAMEQVLVNGSRIPARVTFLKPLSAAISIGTGGPFGAEGPIIATGGALGSLFGQFIYTTPAERKTLLAAGAAAGMAAIFGCPVAAVLLAIELLLFEFRPRSIIPVAFASATAAGLRILWVGSQPVFDMGVLAPVTVGALAFYAILGLALGLIASGITRIVYAVEDAFERLPIHWMWWPALGAVAVGVIGYFAPDTLGVGYYNITAILSHGLPVRFVLFLCVMKFLSWSISLGSGTSGGTLGAVADDRSRIRPMPCRGCDLVYSQRRDRSPGGGTGRHGGDFRRSVSGVSRVAQSLRSRRRCNRSDCCLCSPDAPPAIWYRASRRRIRS